MQVQFNWLALLILVSVANGLFLALVLFRLRKSNPLPRLLLSAFLAAFSLACLHLLFNITRIVYRIPHLYYLFAHFLLLLGPLLYLYVQSLTKPGFSFQRRDWLHFLPFASAVLAFLPVYLRGSAFKLQLMDSFSRLPPLQRPLWMRSYLVLRLLQISVYLVLSIAALARYRRRIKDEFSSLERINLRWLWLLVSIYALGIFLNLVFGTLDFDDPAWIVPLYTAIEAVIPFVIGYRGLLQPAVFAAGAAGSPGPKYVKSALTMEQSEKGLRLLTAFMETDRLYREEDLSLRRLAEKAGLPLGHVSQIINERTGGNFYDFVNGYRVEEAKRLLRDPRRGGEKILTVAFDVGFNSKVAFNRVFKRLTGQTPSAYRAGEGRTMA